MDKTLLDASFLGRSLFFKIKGKSHFDLNLFMTKRQKDSVNFFESIVIICMSSSIHRSLND